MKSFLCLLFVTSLLSLPAFAAFAADSVILRLSSPEKTLTFTAAEFAALPRTEAKLVEQPGQPERTFSGVTMHELLTRAGAPLGDKLRGPAQQTAVIVRCKDNYAVLFALAEFDENFSQCTIILADQEDSQILPPSAGPLRIVTPGDKRGARSARQVIAIEIVSLAKP